MSWDRLPRELFDEVLRYLDYDSIKNFRLVNKSASRGCLNSQFLATATEAETDLTEQSLWDLMARAMKTAFASSVRRLVITSTSSTNNNTVARYSRNGMFMNSTELSKASSKISTTPGTLSAGKKSDPKGNVHRYGVHEPRSDEFIIKILVAALNAFTQLDEISLQSCTVPLHQSKNKHRSLLWNLKSQYASRTCYLTLAAVARSKTRVRAMNIYHNQHRWPFYAEASSSASEDFALDLDRIIRAGLEHSRFGIRSLKLNLSSGVGIADRSLATRSSVRNMMSSYHESSLRPDTTGLIRLLQCMPDLETFSLQFSQDGRTLSGEDWHIFTTITDKVQFQQLRICELDGVPVTAHSLCKFVQRHHHIKVLRIIGAALPGVEEWPSVFSAISCELDLQELRLDRLRWAETKYSFWYDQYISRYYPEDHPHHQKIHTFKHDDPTGPELLILFSATLDGELG